MQNPRIPDFSDPTEFTAGAPAHELLDIAKETGIPVWQMTPDGVVYLPAAQIHLRTQPAPSSARAWALGFLMLSSFVAGVVAHAVWITL